MLPVLPPAISKNVNEVISHVNHSICQWFARFLISVPSFRSISVHFWDKKNMKGYGEITRSFCCYDNFVMKIYCGINIFHGEEKLYIGMSKIELLGLLG